MSGLTPAVLLLCLIENVRVAYFGDEERRQSQWFITIDPEQGESKDGTLRKVSESVRKTPGNLFHGLRATKIVVWNWGLKKCILCWYPG